MLLSVAVPTGHEFAQALVTGALLGGLYAITALGLSLVFGVMRLINLVHGELVVLGAYLAYELTKNGSFDPLLSLVLVAPALFLLAAPVQRWVLEPLWTRGPSPRCSPRSGSR
jgi:branched-chain amino acid transport system permease protein